jgi:mitochondrial fission protein ELM1
MPIDQHAKIVREGQLKEGDAMKVWVLRDERVGSSRQAIALAEIMGWDYDLKEIAYNWLARMPNFLPFVDSLTINKHSLTQLKVAVGDAPDIIIGAGRRLARIMRYLKRHYPNAKLIQILHPQMSISNFDLVLLPYHDNTPGTPPSNVMRIDGAVTHIKPEVLLAARDKWGVTWSRLPDCKIGVLIGGDTARHQITAEDIEALMKQCEQAALKLDGALLITNSRRTSGAANEALVNVLEQLRVPYYFYDCRDGGENPYMGIMACSNYIITTGDSISMCAESVATGKPTFIYANKHKVGKKHWRFIEKLIHNKRANLLKNFSVEAIMYSQDASNELKNKVLAKLTVR